MTAARLEDVPGAIENRLHGFNGLRIDAVYSGNGSQVNYGVRGRYGVIHGDFASHVLSRGFIELQDRMFVAEFLDQVLANEAPGTRDEDFHFSQILGTSL